MLYFVQNIYTLYNKDISHTSKLAPAYTHYLIVYTNTRPQRTGMQYKCLV